MRNFVLHIIGLIFLTFLVIPAISQAPPPPPDDASSVTITNGSSNGPVGGSAPIGDGTYILLGLAAAYVFYNYKLKPQALKTTD